MLIDFKKTSELVLLFTHFLYPIKFVYVMEVILPFEYIYIFFSFFNRKIDTETCTEFEKGYEVVIKKLEVSAVAQN